MSFSPWFRAVAQKYSKASRRAHRIADRRKRNVAPKMYLEPLEERMVLSTGGITTSANPSEYQLAGSSGPLNDSANLSLNTFSNISGSINFVLTYDNISSDVYFESTSTTGSGEYSTSNGYVLPTDGSTVAGSYHWSASYSDEQGTSLQSTNTDLVSVLQANPTISNTPSPTDVTVGSSSQTLNDVASLSGGYFEGGYIEFELFGPSGGSPIYSESASVSGDGNYQMSSGYLLSPGAQGGSYQWEVFYSGDGNNNSAADTSNGLVNVTGSSSLSTTPNQTAATLGTASINLQDTAVLTLADGSTPLGEITFTLTYNPDSDSELVYYETVFTTGSGTYMTSSGFTLPNSGSVAGTYQWDAFYQDQYNNSLSDTGDSAEMVVVSPAATQLSTTPSQSNFTLGTSLPTLQDTATISGYSPTGTLTFTLHNPAGTVVDVETVSVTGSDMYTTPSGYTIPSTGAMAGTYQWDASYSGDTNNISAADCNDSSEQVIASAASPALDTTPNPGSVNLGSAATILKDEATLSGGYNEGGSITFTLQKVGSSAVLDFEIVTVSGDGTYTTPSGYSLPTSPSSAGTYQWNAIYSGDGNNTSSADIGNTNERVVVSAIGATLTTTPSTTGFQLGTGTSNLKDTATLTLNGVSSGSGSITFTLVGPGSTVLDTETVSVSGSGTYMTPTGYTLPSSGTVAGTYQWNAVYTGTAGTVSDVNDSAERVQVFQAAPTRSTTPNPTTVTLGTSAVNLTDTFSLNGGYFPTGSITFTLSRGSTLVDTETVSVTGSGSYTTPSGYTLPSNGTVTGSYQWNANYSGDGNNMATDESLSPAEQVSVTSASPSLTTTPNSTMVVPGTGVTKLQDTATLSAGYYETGTITFMLIGPSSSLIDTETVTVHGNGSYTTPCGYTLPTSGSVSGNYQWNATYTGDGNNASAADLYDPAEQVTVLAKPIVTTPTFTSVTTTSAVLGGNVVSNGGSSLSRRGIAYMVTKPNTLPVLGGQGVFEVDDVSTSTGVFADLVSPLTQTTSYTFVAFATNAAGTSYSPAAVFVTAPSTFISGPSTAPANQPQTFNLFAEDPNPKYQSGKFTFHINWGDKANNPSGYTSVVTALNGATTTHTYLAAGTYTIQITATDSSPAGTVLPVGTFTITITSNRPGVLPLANPSNPLSTGTTLKVAGANGAGAPALLAGTGNNALRAGTGIDSLFGGSVESLLFGVRLTPSFFNEGTGVLNSAALSGILAGWTSSDTLAQRVAALSTGSGLNASYVLNAKTVSDDAGVGLFFEGTNGSDDSYSSFASDKVQVATTMGKQKLL